MLNKLVFVLCFGLALNLSANVLPQSTTEYYSQSIEVFGVIEIIQMDRNKISMDINTVEEVTIQLINANDVVVYEATIENASSHMINTSSFALGTYDLVAKTALGIQTETVLLEE